MGLKKGSFEEGIAKFNHRGSLVEPVRITKRAKEILLEVIADDKSNTSIMFDEDEIGDRHLGYFLDAMQWIEYQLKKERVFKTRLTRRIGWVVQCWIWDNKNHPLSGEPDFDIGMQWLVNKINARYSQFELARWNDKNYHSR